jgi:hypothetical protein
LCNRDDRTFERLQHWAAPWVYTSAKQCNCHHTMRHTKMYMCGSVRCLPFEDHLRGHLQAVIGLYSVAFHKDSIYARKKSSMVKLLTLSYKSGYVDTCRAESIVLCFMFSSSDVYRYRMRSWHDVIQSDPIKEEVSMRPSNTICIMTI